MLQSGICTSLVNPRPGKQMFYDTKERNTRTMMTRIGDASILEFPGLSSIVTPRECDLYQSLIRCVA